LQPLVENAVRHGISRRSAQGEIQIVAKREADTLHLWVRDNGPGFPDPANDRMKNGLGLRLTRERLQAQYGQKQKCEITSSPETGAEIHLQLPFSPIAETLRFALADTAAD